MIRLSRYTDTFAERWNHFLQHCSNATFLFRRDFMDYHKDRITDHSLIFEKNERLVALLPASEHGQILRSHGGLSYGGLLFPLQTKREEVMECLERTRDYLSEQGFVKLEYKPVPTFYHSPMIHSDTLALQQFRPTLLRMETNVVIQLKHSFEFQYRRKRGVRKAEKLGVVIQNSDDWKGYWPLLTENLWEYHKVRPVHSLEEILLLNSRFPKQIQLFVAKLKGELLAGTVLFLFPHVVHAQYIASNKARQEVGANDLLFANLITKFSCKDYFSFGVSDERDKEGINEGLYQWKEGFGARPWPHFAYEIPIT